MLEILNGRDKFYQWDLEQKLIVDDSIIAVHYDNGTGDALVCGVYEYEGQRVADVPNIMLQTCWAIKCYAYCGECVRAERVYEVEKRSRPDDYIYTETETLRYTTLLDMLNDTNADLAALEEKHNEDVAALENVIKTNDRKRQEIVDIHIPNIYDAINENLDSINTLNSELRNTNIKVMSNEGELQQLKQYTGEVVAKIYEEMVEQDTIIYDNEARITELEKRPTGGGTGGASEVDWSENDSTSPSYIKNRTHYEEWQEGTLLAEKSPDMIQDNDGMMMCFYLYPCFETEPLLGAEYTVNYNGVEYKCIGVDGVALGADSGVVIGNYGLLTGGTDTGEPFIFLLYGEEAAAANDGLAIMGFLMDGATELTLKIDYGGMAVHKIDNKYLDLSNYYVKSQIDDKFTNTNSNFTNYYTKPQVDEKFGTPYSDSLSNISCKGISDTGVIDISGYTNLQVDLALQGKQIMDTIKVKMYDSNNTYICDLAVAENASISDVISIQANYVATGLLNIDVEVGNSALLRDMKRYVWRRATTVGTLGTIQIYTVNGTVFGDNAVLMIRGVKP